MNDLTEVNNVNMFFSKSVFFYCIFMTFVFYQQLHFTRFEGSSKVFEGLLSVSVLICMITGLYFNVLYFSNVTWWAPIVLFILNFLSAGPGMLLERVLGKYILSVLGFVFLPVSAYFMFRYIPF